MYAEIIDDFVEERSGIAMIRISRTFLPLLRNRYTKQSQRADIAR
jgi:hypothetical protein